MQRSPAGPPARTRPRPPTPLAPLLTSRFFWTSTSCCLANSAILPSKASRSPWNCSGRKRGAAASRGSQHGAWVLWAGAHPSSQQWQSGAAWCACSHLLLNKFALNDTLLRRAFEQALGVLQREVARGTAVVAAAVAAVGGRELVRREMLHIPATGMVHGLASGSTHPAGGLNAHPSPGGPAVAGGPAAAAKGVLRVCEELPAAAAAAKRWHVGWSRFRRAWGVVDSCVCRLRMCPDDGYTVCCQSCLRAVPGHSCFAKWFAPLPPRVLLRLP